MLDDKTFRIRNRFKGYGAAQTGKMCRATKKMKHSFGVFPPYSRKEPLKAFSCLRNQVNACHESEVSNRMALYAIPHFLSGDAELPHTREQPGSGTVLGVSKRMSYTVAVKWLLQTYAEPHTLDFAPAFVGRS